MSFDTDYLNSQKEKLNESKSNVICFWLTYCHTEVWRAVASKLSKNFAWIITPLRDLKPVDDKVMNLQAFRLILSVKPS